MTEELKTVTLECDCGAEFDHDLFPDEPQNAVRIRTTLCSVCREPEDMNPDEKIFLTYYDENDQEISI